MKKATINTIAGSSAFAIALLISLSAYAEGMAVRYSYAKTEFNGQPIYALIPIPDTRFDSRTNKINVQKAFTALKSDKSNTYLNTTATISGSDKAPIVSIQIDPQAAAKGYGLIIMAEAIYTLGELGVNQISFPGLASHPMRRADIPFVAFTITVPLWKALFPGSRDALNSPNIQVIMPDGTIVPSTVIAQKWRSKDKSIEDALYDYLKAPDTYTVKEVAKLLKKWNLPYGDKVVQLLGNPSTSVQNLGLELLANDRNDKKILESVSAYLNLQKKKDKTQAAIAANWLGLSSNKDFAIEKPLYFLENGTPEQATDAAQELSKFDSKDARNTLSKNLTNDDLNVALASAKALGVLNDTTTEKKALIDKKIKDPVKLVLAKNLAAAKDEKDQLEGLEYLVIHGSVKERTDAITTIGGINSKSARQLLEKSFVSNDEFVANAAAEQMLKRAEIASLNAVAAAIKSNINTERAFAIGDAIMAQLDFQAIEKKTRDRNNEIQRLAYRALGKKSKIRSVLDLLERALDNKDPSIRAAALVSILEFHDKYTSNVEADIKKAAEDKEATVRRSAANAIGELPDGKLADELGKLLNDADPSVAATAIASMAKRGEAFAWDAIKEKTKASDDELRAAAYLALAKLVSKQDAKGVREVISSLSGAVGDKSKIVKIAAIHGLGEFKDDRAVASIAVNASNDDIAIRIATLEAVANSGHASAKPLLIAGLDDPESAVRLSAIKGLAKLKDPSIKSDLAKRINRESDPEIKKAMEDLNQTL